MDLPTFRPETLEEKIVHCAIVGTWGFWLIGGLYLLAPAMGWLLLLLAVYRIVWLPGGTALVSARPMPPGVMLWIVGMVGMLIALVMGHLNFDLGVPALIKSSIGWAKGWALMAVYPIAGAMLQIRPAIIYRAACKLGLQTLIISPVLVLAMLVGLPGHLYVSPLSIIGGPGPEFFDVELYSYDASTGNPRWRFFAPWAPGAAFVANIYLVMAVAERNWRWRAIGIAASVVMCVLSQSRLGLITAPATLLIVFVLSNLTRPYILALGSFLGTLTGLMLGIILEIVTQLLDDIASARAASTRVRKILGNIAIERWQNEAPVFGHGVVERGPHLVEYMPIGSHHSWYGLLYVKGAVGFVALALPLAWSLVELILKSQASRTARAALGVIIVLSFYSFGENLEILVYLYWPGMIVIGVALRQRLVSPARMITMRMARRHRHTAEASGNERG